MNDFCKELYMTGFISSMSFMIFMHIMKIRFSFLTMPVYKTNEQELLRPRVGDLYLDECNEILVIMSIHIEDDRMLISYYYPEINSHQRCSLSFFLNYIDWGEIRKI